MTIALHNFLNPAPLPADEHGRLAAWFRSALGMVLRAWGRDFGLEAQGEAAAPSVERVSETVATLPLPFLGYRIAVGPHELPSLLVLPRPIFDLLLATLLRETPGSGAAREPTEIELSLTDYFLQAHWLPVFKDTWPGPLRHVWQLGQAQEPEQALRLFEPAEEVVVFRWLLRGPCPEQQCAWLFRRHRLKELYSGAGAEVTAALPQRPRVETLVRGLDLDVIVLLGQVELRLAQLAQLRAGDVVLLNQRVSEPLPVHVGEKMVGRGWPGRSGTAKACRIESLAEV
jgi:flagellar motor switch protein FliM